MSVKENLCKILESIPKEVTLVAVTKTHPQEIIMEAYNAGHKIFGENKVQEMVGKQKQIPDDAEWHLVGHLQTNKVKYIAPFVKLVHSVDSLKLLREIDKQAKKNNRVIACLLQIHIAKEETKFGLAFSEAEQLLASPELQHLQNIRIIGLMGMATNTENELQIRNEFRSLAVFFKMLRSKPGTSNFKPEILSMGMTSDYKIAIEESSNMIRIGSAIFGTRNYKNDR